MKLQKRCRIIMQRCKTTTEPQNDYNGQKMTTKRHNKQKEPQNDYKAKEMQNDCTEMQNSYKETQAGCKEVIHNYKET